MNMTIILRARCMLSNAKMHRSFWAEAASTACYLINRSPSVPLDKKTPIEVWSGSPADYSDLRVFGCTAYAHVDNGKLEPRAVKCIFLGYGSGVKAYRLWNPETKKIVLSRNVVFNEAVMFNDSPSTDISDAIDSPDVSDDEQHRIGVQVEHTKENENVVPETNNDDNDVPPSPPIVQRQGRSIAADRPKRNIAPPTRLIQECDIVDYALSCAEQVEHDIEPATYTEAIASVDKEKWHSSIRAFFGIVAMHDLELEQLDVKTAFLHGELEEEIYMDQPEGYVVPEMASPINFNQFLEKEKLKSNGSNFTDWFRHVRIFLSGGNLQYVLDAPLGDPPAETETDEVKAVYETRKIRYSQVQCAMCSLESDLQKRFEHHDPHELMKELKAIFETHAAVECYEASKQFFSCMMEEGSSVSEHMLAMTGHAKKLSDLGIVIPNRLGINRVLQSLPPSYKNFVMNYNMQNMNKELPELFGMLKAEIEIKKEHQVLMVNKTTFKKQGKSKGKFKKGGKKAATPPMKPKNGPKPDAECYYCKEKGHWKRNCSKYLADLKSGLVKKKKEGISDIHVIDVYLTGSRSSTWVFDTGSVAHICNSK
ncbi:hypothetical protein QYE76_062218 [Lolium multiflorum]|uniref:CCHC-type domain-containing protein n=1 Tax=Lolium multiflorum TaxID=4521 RepID=A0AAD8S3U8_LOLMU|nr:hypothetical protein QYE76_062218 [Lolium multiflorum]